MFWLGSAAQAGKNIYIPRAAPPRPGFGGPRGFGAPHGYGYGDRGFGYHGYGGGHLGYNHYAFRYHDVRRFGAGDLRRWRAGAWQNTCFGGRCGWWWAAGGTYYFYNAPVYPYPLVVPQITYADPAYAYPDATAAPAPLALKPAPRFRYYCNNPPGYYPQVPNCNGQYQEVPVP